MDAHAQSHTIKTLSKKGVVEVGGRWGGDVLTVDTSEQDGGGAVGAGQWGRGGQEALTHRHCSVASQIFVD